MWKTIVKAFLLLLGLTLLTGVLYPLAVTGIAEVCFPAQANGSLIYVQSRPVGSSLIGQDFQGEQYFHGRPSASGYDAQASGGSNQAPTNRQLIATVGERVNAVRQENRLAKNQPVPSELVTAAASGLDPHITPAGAQLQASRVAKIRKLTLETVSRLIDQATERPFLGLFGVSRVNVLRLNVALDSLQNRG